MRYPDSPREVNDLLDFAREVRRFTAKYPDYVHAPDILQSVATFAADWGWDLLDLVLDHEERIGQLPSEGETAAEQARVPKIETVDRVTIEHGLAFAQGWYDGDDMSDACDDTGIMTWPDGGVEMKETQLHCHDLADEICANVFELMKRQIAEAFVRAANEVLARERSEQE
jgi:hypothetical protein